MSTPAASGPAGRRVGVVMGGLSSEREVSLETGAGVVRALVERGYDCVAIDWAPGSSLPALLTEHRIEVVWNALHGTYGEDGAVQGLCACMGVACTGSGILASALAMDKLMSKRMFDALGLRTPAWLLLDPGADATEALAGWELPLVVKPAQEGSSVGVTIVAERAGLAAAVAEARAHRGPTLVERYIAGAELCVGILADRVLGSLEIRPKVRFYDYQAKYKRDDTEYLVPPVSLDPATTAAAEELSLAAYRALGCTGYGRVDLRVDEAGVAYLLEVNTLPGMTGHSLLPKIAAHCGIDYAALCERILALAA
ncbi:D-alanine--D-alanine ligase [Haliangium sp.]|uniref:D-alanine--D-alanine ligase n=1 Tax=Haliangium sp. TaxID=2663208 RepID=UPI003D0E2CC4